MDATAIKALIEEAIDKKAQPEHVEFLVEQERIFRCCSMKFYNNPQPFL